MADDWYCDELLSGQTPVRVVRETANIIAFHHTRPHYPTHVVVVPKRHIESLLTLSPEDDALLLELLSVVRSVAAELTEAEGGVHVVTNTGKYQESKHLHVHVGAGEPVR